MSSEQRPTAVIIDDSRAVQLGLPLMAPAIEFIAAFETVESFMQSGTRADLVVLDLRLTAAVDTSVVQGPAAIRRLAQAGYAVCIYSDERRRFLLAQCIAAGAMGLVHKSDRESDVEQMLLSVTRGEVVITQALTGLAELLDHGGGLPDLTDRQREVLRGRARGEKWSVIAKRLFITEGVAREHMAAVTAKFAKYLQAASPADIEQQLGIAPDDSYTL